MMEAGSATAWSAAAHQSRSEVRTGSPPRTAASIRTALPSSTREPGRPGAFSVAGTGGDPSSSASPVGDGSGGSLGLGQGIRDPDSAAALSSLDDPIFVVNDAKVVHDESAEQNLQCSREVCERQHRQIQMQQRQIQMLLREQHRSRHASSARASATGGGSIPIAPVLRILPLSGNGRSDERSRSAPVPSVVRDILSPASSRVLLPREEEVRTVVDALLSGSFGNHDRSSGDGSPPSSDDGRGQGEALERRDGATAGASEIAGRETTTDDVARDAGRTVPLGRLPLTSCTTSSPTRPKLFDLTQFSTIVHGMGGMGKTTIAAITVSREDVRTRFRDGIGWIRLGQHGSGIGDDASAAFDTSMPPFGGNYDSNNSGRLSYADYVDHLSALCRQINVPIPDFDDVVFLPGDDERIRKQKTRSALEGARQEMTNLLNGRAVLIVLDDLWHTSDLEWSMFANRPTSLVRLLITTRVQVRRARRGGPTEEEDREVSSRSSPDAMRSREVVIKLGALKEEEAVKLLFREARSLAPSTSCSLPMTGHRIWTDEEKGHALTIVRCCKCLPVAIRFVGRLLSTGMSQHGQTIEQLASELSSGGSGTGGSILGASAGVTTSPWSKRHEVALYDILDRSFSPELHGNVMATLLKVCFTAFSMVFARADSNRPWVPIPAIHMLCNDLVLGAELSALDMNPEKSVIMQLMEKMQELGLVDSCIGGGRTRAWRGTGDDETAAAVTTATANDVLCYKVHHDLLLQYARHTWGNDDALEPSEMYRRIHGITSKAGGPMMRGRKKIRGARGSQATLLECMHLIIAHRYDDKRKKMPNTSWDLAIADDGYVFEHLPRHMIMAGGKMCKETFMLLRDNGFIRGRMASMGVERGTKVHVIDVETLNHRYPYSKRKRNRTEDPLNSEALSTVRSLCSYLRKQLPGAGATKQPDSRSACTEHEVGNAFITIGKSLQQQNLWVHALDVFSEALEILKVANLADDHPDVVRTHDYANASALLRLVLVPRDSSDCIKLKNAAELRADASADNRGRTKPTEGIPLEFSSHPGLGIVLLRQQFSDIFGASFLQLGIGPKESALQFCVHKGQLWNLDNEFVMVSTSGCHGGDNVFVVSSSLMDSKAKWPGEFIEYNFAVNDDGTISPKVNPDVAVGLGPYPLMLVPRNSPNRFIFKHGKALRKHQLPKVGHDPSGEDGYPLELLSHPGRALTVQMSSLINLGPARINIPGMGMAKDALRVSYDGRIIASSKDGAVIRLNEMRFEAGAASLSLFRGNKRSMTCWKGGPNDFVINEEGSISPKLAPNLALGCTCLGKANEIITEDEKCIAEEQSRMKPKEASLSSKFHALQLGLGVATQFQPSNSRVDEYC